VLAPQTQINVHSTRRQTETVQEAGFSGKENGELPALANQNFDVFVTIDKNIGHQQNISRLKLAIIVIRAASNDAICTYGPTSDGRRRLLKEILKVRVSMF
jgi:hypothetical protein